MHKLQQAIKWTVYTLLIVNFAFYIEEDWVRALHTLNENSTLSEWAGQFATSIDETAWFLLLFMYELETYVLSNQVLEGWTERVVRGLRLICFAMLAHTIYAYGADVIELQPTIQVEGISDLCAMADQDVSYVFNLEYTAINKESCSDLSDAREYFWRTENISVTSADGLQLERDLAWVDLIEAVVWLFIVLAIELVVRLQGRGVTGGPLIKTSNTVQVLLYGLLLAIGVYWASLSHWLYLWDELVWIGGFAAIEMNLSDWRDEMIEEKEQATA